MKRGRRQIRSFMQPGHVTGRAGACLRAGHYSIPSKKVEEKDIKKKDLTPKMTPKIAAVGAGLRAFTRFACVEYANGEEVPAEKFLAEVEEVVLETLLEGAGEATGLAGLHGSTPEQAVLKKLVANWRALIEQRLADKDLRSGQRRLVE